MRNDKVGLVRKGRAAVPLQSANRSRFPLSSTLYPSTVVQGDTPERDAASRQLLASPRRNESSTAFARPGFHFADIPLWPNAHLKITTPGDSSEQEADQIAEQVIHPPQTPNVASPQQIRVSGVRGIIPSASPLTSVLSSHVNPPMPTPTGDVEAHIRQHLRGGQPLDASTSASMGQAFSFNFRAVRVHADPSADLLNRQLYARAFTLGSDIFFRRGAYNPVTLAGRALIAHELTHVVQQNGGANLIQRSFLPLEDPGPEDRARIFDVYREIIKYRSATGQIKEAIGRLLLGTDALAFKKAHADLKSTDASTAWQGLANFITLINQSTPAEQEGALIPMEPKEQEEIWQKIQETLSLTEKLIRDVIENTPVLEKVFGAKNVPDAQENFKKIHDQLSVYRNEKNIEFDVSGALGASGTTLQNSGNAKQAEAVMTVTRNWAAKSLEKRQTAFVHEASHGSAVGTRDLAYLRTWALGGLLGEEALKNAPHYEGAAEMHLGLSEFGQKPLEIDSEQPALDDQKLRKLLASSDKFLTKARLRSGAVLKALKALKNDEKVEQQTLSITLETAKALTLPFTQREGARITNADVELLLIYRSILETMHKKLSNITGVNVITSPAALTSFKEGDGKHRFSITSQLLDKGESASMMLLAEIAKSVEFPSVLPADPIPVMLILTQNLE